MVLVPVVRNLPFLTYLFICGTEQQETLLSRLAIFKGIHTKKREKVLTLEMEFHAAWKECYEQHNTGPSDCGTFFWAQILNCPL